MNRYLMPVIFFVAALCWAALIFIPPDYTTSTETDSHPYDRITGVSVLKAPVNRAIWYAGLACVPLLLLTSAKYFRRADKPAFLYCVVTLTIAVPAFPYALLRRVGHSLAPWVVCDTVSGPDGDSYVFLDSSFLQGQMLALGRILPDTLFHTRFEILGWTNGDSPRSFAVLVRPTDNIKIGYGQLYFTDDNRLLGLRYDNECYFAYDFETGRFDGHGDIESLSPFTLVSANSSLYKADVESFLTYEYWPPVDSAKELPFGVAILNATNHANPEVRAVAQQLIERFDAGKDPTGT